MSFPVINQVQFNAASGEFEVDEVTDPNGGPAEVLDTDLGFDIKGKLRLPNWLVGTGTITVYAHEIGGTFNQSIGETTVTLVRPSPPAEPEQTEYPWQVTVAPNTLPDPQPNESQIYELVVQFVYLDQLTDIGGFVDLGKYMID